MSDEGRLVAGRYRVIRRIGAGAMGAVWQAHDDVLQRTVAIKQLLLQLGLDENEAEEARQRTMREGRIAARLHHPNAITVFDVVTDDNGQPCLIMEYLASTSLAQELQQRTTLPALDVAQIGAQIAAALKEAHAVGIVHRDIKPGNILLADNGVVKITDFGISRATDDVTVTKTGMIAGTPAYLAPEVAIGGNPGPESDIFSLGSTLYAATEGQPPFGLSENTLSLLHAVAAGQINPPRQSGPLTSVLAVMLHPDVRHRPTAGECEELLSAVARGETPLGGAGQATQVHPTDMDDTAVLGITTAALAGGALAASANDDLVPTAHHGTLAATGDPYYRETPSEGYPGERYDDFHRANTRPDATRAVPAASGGYEPYDHYDNDRYDDRDHPNSYEPYDDEPQAGERSARGDWKVPAAIGTMVVAGMAAFAIWLFGDSSGSDAEQDPMQQRQVATTSNMPTTSTTTEQTTSVSEEPDTQSEEQVAPTTENPPPVRSESPKDTSEVPTSTEESSATTQPTTTQSPPTDNSPPPEQPTTEA